MFFYSEIRFFPDVFLNWVGVKPVSRLKRELNEFDVWNPTSNAISVTDFSVVCNNVFARFILVVVRYSE